MSLTSAVLDAANDGATAILGYAAIHSSSSSGSQTSNERRAITWGSSSGAVATSTAVPLAFTGTPGAAATHLGIWSALSGGTFRGYKTLSGDQTFNAAGAYNVTALTLTASSGA
jgi:hypothetical protein